MSVFILPKGCIKRIESLCSKFLWAGNTDTSGQAKIAWTTVCLPKAEGGLGIRSLTMWNKVLCLRFLWLLFSDSKSLWAIWNRRYNLQGKSLWTLEISTSNSWTWNHLLKLKELGMQFVKPILGNGHSVSFWYDAWTPFGSLINFLGQHAPRQLRVPLHSTVSEACSTSGWNIASPRSNGALELHTSLTTIPCPTFSEMPDSYTWCTTSREEPKFNASNTWQDLRPTWQDLRPRGPIQTASGLIWFKGAIPRNSFNMWVANMNRLPTRARLASWGLPVPTACCLCSAYMETRDHLFLSCSYSSTVWELCIGTLNPPSRMFSTWSELLSWIRGNSPSAPSLLRKLAAQSILYHLYKQRNNVLHNRIVLPPEAIFRNIDKEMQNTITARRRRKHFLDLMAK